jgi:uncharacterized protein YbcV (DUF1398 family)
MKDDPIITEVREARHRISEAHGHDLDRLTKHYQEYERELAKTGKYKFVTEFFSTSTTPELVTAK